MRSATWMAARLEALGALDRAAHRTSELGDTVVATFEGRSDGPTVMLIGHADTVFDVGYLARRPFEVRDDRILGPGVSDMKGGLLAGLYALEALRALRHRPDDWLPVGRLIYVVNPDEEIGSPVSSGGHRRAGPWPDAAFVMEAARANGDIVSARKGMMHLRATIHGRSAHAGVEPEKGRSATLEAAHKTVALHALNGRWPGVTVNVGSIDGGTRPNIVAEEAVITIDMRARHADEQDEAEAAIYEILQTSTVPDVSTDIEKLAHSRPMEKTEDSAELVDCGRRHRRRAGLRLGRCRDRRRFGRQHHRERGRAFARRPGPHRRQRPHAPRVHRDEQHRPEDDAARCAAAVSRRLTFLRRAAPARSGSSPGKMTPSTSMTRPQLSWVSSRERGQALVGIGPAILPCVVHRQVLRILVAPAFGLDPGAVFIGDHGAECTHAPLRCPVVHVVVVDRVLVAADPRVAGLDAAGRVLLADGDRAPFGAGGRAIEASAAAYDAAEAAEVSSVDGRRLGARLSHPISGRRGHQGEAAGQREDGHAGRYVGLL